ncbi:MAG: 3-isopropylmalate dehydrogenase [Candidatus Marinamargulisbacteria bacterium]|jgi:3-isopropylmalate dehydrogenase
MYKIAVIGGDGTGPEVIHEAIKVLQAVESDSLSFSFDKLPYNGDRYIREKKTVSDTEIENLKTYDAILLGAIGHPDIKPGIIEKGILLKLRFDLDQYINLRPVKLYNNVPTPLKDKGPRDIDYVVVRENTGGLYSGNGGVSMKNTPHETATQEMVYTRYQVERCIRYAFDYALKRHQERPWANLTAEEKSQGFVGKVTLCGKTNVLTYVYDLWQRTLDAVAKDYPTIKTDYVHVDAACIYMIESPERFDVIVTGNMFGDIITDLAAVTQGGMGVASGGNINPEGVSMFEPIGGTAPLFTGKNEINPLAAIGAAQMMLEHLGENEASLKIETSKMAVIEEMTSMAAGQMGFSTTEIGDMIASKLKEPILN